MSMQKEEQTFLKKEKSLSLSNHFSAWKLQ